MKIFCQVATVLEIVLIVESRILWDSQTHLVRLVNIISPEFDHPYIIFLVVAYHLSQNQIYNVHSSSTKFPYLL